MQEEEVRPVIFKPNKTMNLKNKVNQLNVDFIRESRGKIRQVDLAEQFGITQGQVCHIQKNKYWTNRE